MAIPSSSPTPQADANGKKKGGSAQEKAPRKLVIQPRWLRYSTTAVIVIEIVLLIACLGRGIELFKARLEANRLLSSQKQAEDIRSAWAELADQGRVLRTRLSQAKARPEDTLEYIQGSIKKARVKLEVAGPLKTEKGKRSSDVQFKISGFAPEGRALEFLLLLDNIPSISEIDEINIRGASGGRVDLYISIIHHDYPSRLMKKLKALIKKLPDVPPIPATPRKLRDGRIFAPVVLPPEAVLTGWPNILLSGFSENSALFMVNGVPVTVSEGNAITKGITFVEKLSVNQAIIRRSSDGAEIILAVGSRSYAVKPSPLRDMGEFVLAVQRRGSSDLLGNGGPAAE